jgi:hypothetical protein
MPVAVELNGLLPGRGPAGRDPRWPGAPGRGPGRGELPWPPSCRPRPCCPCAGAESRPVAGCAGALGASGTLGATGAAGTAAAAAGWLSIRSSSCPAGRAGWPPCWPGRGLAGRGAPGRGPAGALNPPAPPGPGTGRGACGRGPGLGPDCGWAACGAAGAAACASTGATGAATLLLFLAGAGREPPLLPPPFCESAASASLRRLTTGASIVEDAERTNSPIS